MMVLLCELLLTLQTRSPSSSSTLSAAHSCCERRRAVSSSLSSSALSVMIVHPVCAARRVHVHRHWAAAPGSGADGRLALAPSASCSLLCHKPSVGVPRVRVGDCRYGGCCVVGVARRPVVATASASWSDSRQVARARRDPSRRSCVCGDGRHPGGGQAGSRSRSAGHGACVVSGAFSVRRRRHWLVHRRWGCSDVSARSCSSPLLDFRSARWPRRFPREVVDRRRTRSAARIQ